MSRMFFKKNLRKEASSRRHTLFKIGKKYYVVVKYDKNDIASFERYLKLNDIFQKAGLNVPILYTYNKKRSYIIEEYLGDIELASYVNTLYEKGDFNGLKLLYQKLLDFAFLFSNKVDFRKQIILEPYAFTYEVFLEELVKTYELLDFLPSFCKLNGFFYNKVFLYDVAYRVSKIRYAFVHRDFHSRNIMLYRGDFYLLDYQDARFGPYLYDVASLFADPYNFYTARMSLDMVLTFVKEYFGNTKREEFKREDFLMVYLQRLYKMLGTFLFLVCNGKNGYKAYIPVVVRKLNEVSNIL